MLRSPLSAGSSRIASITTWMSIWQYVLCVPCELFSLLFQDRTIGQLPFQLPLLGLLLRGYLIEGRRSKQDTLLVAKLKREECIPVPMIAMCTVLVGFHTLTFTQYLFTSTMVYLYSDWTCLARIHFGIPCRDGSFYQQSC